LQFIFAVIAVQLFNGKFFYCSDQSKHLASECQVILGHLLFDIGSGAQPCSQGEFFEFGDSWQPPKVLPREWRKQQFHYDNVAAAMLTLFAVQTTEGWPA
jgi:hypothetical protein